MTRYEELDPKVQAYLHTLELREYYRTTTRINCGDTHKTLQNIQTHLFGAGSSQWEDEIKLFLSKQQQRSTELRQLIPYYLTAGCGVNRICRYLQVGQATVYDVKKTINERRYDFTATPVFWNEQTTIFKLQQMLEDVNILDGFRILDRHNYPRNSFEK